MKELTIEQIVDDYKADALNDNENEYLLKDCIFKVLSEQERRVLLLYTDNASCRKTAKILNCSIASVSNYIKAIRKKLKDNDYSRPILDNYHSDTDNR